MGSVWQEKDGAWKARWKDHTGRYRSKRFKSKKIAQHALHRKEIECDEIRAGMRKAPRDQLTFNQLCDHWAKFKVPQKRSGKDDLSIIRRYLRPTFGDFPLEEISAALADEFASELGLSPKSAHNILTLFISMLREAKRRKWLAEVPEIQKPSLADNSLDFRYLETPEIVKRFLLAAKEEREDIYALYATAVFTGMRAGELAGLRRDGVDLSKRLITVRFSFNGPTKANYIRKVPILDELLPILREWLIRNPLEFVFPNQVGNMHQPAARVFQETLHKVLERAELHPRPDATGKMRPYVTFHGLRHTFASHWMMNGGSLFKLQQIGGWRSPQLVQRYAHLSPESYAEDYGRLSGLVPGDGAEVIELRAGTEK